MISLYERIQAAENDIDEWFKLLCEAEDHTFVCHNVEYRLGANLLNLQLWKLYIEYLKTAEPKQMLHVYSKYCRFFLDDSEMKEKYKAEMEVFGPIKLPWKNLFDFEEAAQEVVHESSEDRDAKQRAESKKWQAKLDTLYPASPARDAFDKNLPKRFYETFKLQAFALPKPIIWYILQHGVGHGLLKNLHISCKHFFILKPTPICYSLGLKRKESDWVIRFRDDSMELNSADETMNLFKNLHLTTSLLVQRRTGVNFLSSIIPRLCKCTAKYINIKQQNLSFEEFKFLIESGNVIRLKLWGNKITFGKAHDQISLEMITEFLPNIEDLR